MPEPEAPIARTIGISGVIRFVIAFAAVIAVGSAFAQGRYWLGAIGTVVILLAAVLGYQAWKARRDAAGRV